MPSDLYGQTMFDNSSLSSSVAEPQLQSYLFSSAGSFPPVAPDTATEISKKSSHAFQPFLREQNQNSQYEASEDTSAHMEEDEEVSECVSLPPRDDGCEIAASPMVSLFGNHNVNSNDKSPLDIRVGSNTADMYSRMREVQLNHLPKYQPNSPYIKYRR